VLFLIGPLPPIDFQGLARSVLLREWQGKWDAADTVGHCRTLRFAQSILPRVSLRPWFDGQAEDRKFVSTVSRIMSGHCTARSHLSRFRIVEGAICIGLKDYETVDHLLWYCKRFEAKRRRLTDAFTALDVQRGTSVRDLCALKKWRAMKCCLDFLGNLRIRICELGFPFSRIAGQILHRTLNGLGQWSNWKTCHL
jgi:hypothetical protein